MNVNSELMALCLPCLVNVLYVCVLRVFLCMCVHVGLFNSLCIHCILCYFCSV